MKKLDNKPKAQENKPQIILTALSHLAFCALVALGIARKDGIALTPLAENLFLIRWLATAQKQKRFPKCVAIDITFLLEQGRKKSSTSKLRDKLEYLWQSCTKPLSIQSDLFRLTYATEKLKEQGWENFIIDSNAWRDERFPKSSTKNAFCIEENTLHIAYSDEGRLIIPLKMRVIGEVDYLLTLLFQSFITTELTERGKRFHRVTLLP